MRTSLIPNLNPDRHGRKLRYRLASLPSSTGQSINSSMQTKMEWGGRSEQSSFSSPSPSAELSFARPPSAHQLETHAATGSFFDRDAQPVEQQIIDTWKTGLGLNEIDLDSNFFDLGGNSAIAVRTVIRVERILGRSVDVGALFRAPTLRSFLKEVTATSAQPTPVASGTGAEARRAPTNEQIVEIRATGDKAPVFVLNNMAVLFPLARALGEEHPVYALQLCPSATPLDLPPRDFRDLARDVVDLIRTARPNGPYILMGLCVFGTLAFEAAQQLRDAGEAVELVVLNDTWAPGHIKSLPKQEQRVRANLRRARNVSREFKRVFARERSLSEFLAGFTLLRKFGMIKLGEQLGMLEADVTETVMRTQNRWYTAYLLHAREGYQPTVYPGDVLVVRCEETLNGRYFADDLGWTSIVGGRLYVMDSPERHADMYLEAGSRALSRGIRIMLGE